MVGIQAKHCLLDTLLRRYSAHTDNGYCAPEDFAITVMNDNDFGQLMERKMRLHTYGEAKRILQTTLAAEVDVIALRCGPELYREVASVFEVSQLSEYGNNFLELILSSGWFMVDPAWEDGVIVIFRDRNAVASCRYWEFFEDPRAFTLDSTTSRLVATMAYGRGRGDQNANNKRKRDD